MFSMTIKESSKCICQFYYSIKYKETKCFAKDIYQTKTERNVQHKPTINHFNHLQPLLLPLIPLQIRRLKGFQTYHLFVYYLCTFKVY